MPLKGAAAKAHCCLNSLLQHVGSIICCQMNLSVLTISQSEDLISLAEMRCICRLTWVSSKNSKSVFPDSLRAWSCSHGYPRLPLPLPFASSLLFISSSFLFVWRTFKTKCYEKCARSLRKRTHVLVCDSADLSSQITHPECSKTLVNRPPAVSTIANRAETTNVLVTANENAVNYYNGRGICPKGMAYTPQRDKPQKHFMPNERRNTKRHTWQFHLYEMPREV